MEVGNIIFSFGTEKIHNLKLFEEEYNFDLEKNSEDVYISFEKKYELSEYKFKDYMLEKRYKYTESMKDELDYYLYSHQIKTIENIEKYNNLLISTGPNSGKTTSYLMLIIDHVLKNKYEKGLKSIIVYPDKDSLKKDIDKIEKIIKNSNIEIGLILDNPLKNNSKNIIENKDILIKSPPDILIVDPMSLDKLLVIPDERKIFKKENLKYIVFEQMDKYVGMKMTHLNYLKKRIKNYFNKNLSYIGTLNTLIRKKTSDPYLSEKRQEIREFGKDFFELYDFNIVLQYIEPIYEEKIYFKNPKKIDYKKHIESFSKNDYKGILNTVFNLESLENEKIIEYFLTDEFFQKIYEKLNKERYIRLDELIRFVKDSYLIIYKEKDILNMLIFYFKIFDEFRKYTDKKIDNNINHFLIKIFLFLNRSKKEHVKQIITGMTELPKISKLDTSKAYSQHINSSFAIRQNSFKELYNFFLSNDIISVADIFLDSYKHLYYYGLLPSFDYREDIIKIFKNSLFIIDLENPLKTFYYTNAIPALVEGNALEIENEQYLVLNHHRRNNSDIVKVEKIDEKIEKKKNIEMKTGIEIKNERRIFNNTILEVTIYEEAIVSFIPFNTLEKKEEEGRYSLIRDVLKIESKINSLNFSEKIKNHIKNYLGILDNEFHFITKEKKEENKIEIYIADLINYKIFNRLSTEIIQKIYNATKNN